MSYNSILWENFRLGDKEAFAKIYTAYVDVLFRYGTKICNDENVVKDAIQEVFLDLYLKRNRNETNPENIKFYLILALKRNLIKKLKKNRTFTTERINNDSLFGTEYSIEKQWIEKEKKDELTRKIKDALNNITPKQKEVLYLRYNESLKYDEISILLNISVESARKQVYRALKTIRKIIMKK